MQTGIHCSAHHTSTVSGASLYNTCVAVGLIGPFGTALHAAVSGEVGGSWMVGGTLIESSLGGNTPPSQEKKGDNIPHKNIFSSVCSQLVVY